MIKTENRLQGFEIKLKEIEQKTLWKITDCENLLKIRVNEQFVRDAIEGLEKKLDGNSGANFGELDDI